jgi:hypothetical protein
MAKLQKQKADWEANRAAVEKAERGRAALEEFEKDQEFKAKGVEAIDKLRQKGLEQYGTEESKLNAKQARERKELEFATTGNREQADALEQMDQMHAVERQKLQISEQEKKLRHHANHKIESGVDINSAEGIKAINRALTGPMENTLEQQALEVSKEQLKTLRQIAAGKPASVSGSSPRLEDLEPQNNGLAYAPGTGGSTRIDELSPSQAEDYKPGSTASRPAADNGEIKRLETIARTAEEQRRLLQSIERKSQLKVVSLSG